MANTDLSVDLDAMAHAIAAMRQSVVDMHGIWAKVTTGDFDFPDGTFTLLDPGVQATYTEVRTYVVKFLADMESRFTTMSVELENVLNAYGNTDTVTGTNLTSVAGQIPEIA